MNSRSDNEEIAIVLGRQFLDLIRSAGATSADAVAALEMARALVPLLGLSKRPDVVIRGRER